MQLPDSDHPIWWMSTDFDMNCSFVAWVGKPSSHSYTRFPIWSLFGLFFVCQWLIWLIWLIEKRNVTKEYQLSVGGCEGHLFMTSDPTSCSCPSSKHSSQASAKPSLLAWHMTNFLQHFSLASFPLSIWKGFSPLEHVVDRDRTRTLCLLQWYTRFQDIVLLCFK